MDEQGSWMRSEEGVNVGINVRTEIKTELPEINRKILKGNQYELI